MDFSSSLRANLFTLKRAAGDSLNRAQTLVFSNFISVARENARAGETKH